MINLLYLNDFPVCGEGVFTAHLCRGLEGIGEEYRLLKLKNVSRPETYRNFGFGLKYRNVGMTQLRMMTKYDEPILIVAPGKRHSESIERLSGLGVRMVVHDSRELRHGWNPTKLYRPVVIRDAMKKLVHGSVWLPHPYQRRYEEKPQELAYSAKKGYVSVARVDYNKNTHLILAANRLLPASMKVRIVGRENRMYSYHVLRKKFPEWSGSQGFSCDDLHEGVVQCLPRVGCVDMTIMPDGDGGGTQYTFFEAIDAGTVPIVHPTWPRRGDEMRAGFNCMSPVDDDPETIARLLRRLHEERAATREVLLPNGGDLLRRHDAKTVAALWLKELAR